MRTVEELEGLVMEKDEGSLIQRPEKYYTEEVYIGQRPCLSRHLFPVNRIDSISQVLEVMETNRQAPPSSRTQILLADQPYGTGKTTFPYILLDMASREVYPEALKRYKLELGLLKKARLVSINLPQSAEAPPGTLSKAEFIRFFSSIIIRETMSILFDDKLITCPDMDPSIFFRILAKHFPDEHFLFHFDELQCFHDCIVVEQDGSICPLRDKIIYFMTAITSFRSYKNFTFYFSGKGAMHGLIGTGYKGASNVKSPFDVVRVSLNPLLEEPIKEVIKKTLFLNLDDSVIKCHEKLFGEQEITEGLFDDFASLIFCWTGGMPRIVQFALNYVCQNIKEPIVDIKNVRALEADYLSSVLDHPDIVTVQEYLDATKEAPEIEAIKKVFYAGIFGRSIKLGALSKSLEYQAAWRLQMSIRTLENEENRVYISLPVLELLTNSRISVISSARALCKTWATTGGHLSTEKGTAYERLVSEFFEWLLTVPRTLEDIFGQNPQWSTARGLRSLRAWGQQTFQILDHDNSSLDKVKNSPDLAVIGKMISSKPNCMFTGSQVPSADVFITANDPKFIIALELKAIKANLIKSVVFKKETNIVATFKDQDVKVLHLFVTTGPIGRELKNLFEEKSTCFFDNSIVKSFSKYQDFNVPNYVGGVFSLQNVQDLQFFLQLDSDTAKELNGYLEAARKRQLEL